MDCLRRILPVARMLMRERSSHAIAMASPSLRNGTEVDIYRSLRHAPTSIRCFLIGRFRCVTLYSATSCAPYARVVAAEDDDDDDDDDVDRGSGRCVIYELLRRVLYGSRHDGTSEKYFSYLFLNFECVVCMFCSWVCMTMDG